MVYILLANGFEEGEAVVPADMLRRGGCPVALVGVTGPMVTGAHGIVVQSDIPLSQVNPEDMELLMLPGGLDGVNNLAANETVVQLIRKAAEGPGKLAAICAAPTLLGKLGLLQGKNAVCYPGMESGMTGANPVTDCYVAVDGDVITGKGPGAAFDFGLKLVEVLKGADVAAEVAGDACWAR